MAALPPGKIPQSLLREVLALLPGDASVLVGPGVGEDAAICAVPGGRLLVATADPITLAPQDPARYAIRVNANDIYAAGGTPRYFLVTLLLPEGTTAAEVRRLFGDLAASAAREGVTVVGGHTEIVRGLGAAILSGHMIGFLEAERVAGVPRARPGDALVLCGEIAVEGTAIMARAAPEACAAVLGERGRARAAGAIEDPGMSVGPAARALYAAAMPRACHDPTEGGLLAAAAELAAASGLGVRLVVSQVAVLPECAGLCEAFGLDPLRLIASGALLCALDPGDVDRVETALRREGIPSRRVGELRPAAEGCVLVEGDVPRPFPEDLRDEIVRFHCEVLPGL